MAQNIYKHRRGTTQEWLEIDLIPEEGELVIEECQDGSRKCKIGDGISKFSILPYLDTTLQATLLKKFDELSKAFNIEIETVKSQIENKLNETAQALATADRLAEEKLEASFIKADELLSEKLTTAFNSKISDTEKALNTQISTTTTSLRTDLIDYKNSSDSAIKNIASDVAAISEEFSKKLTELNASVDTRVSGLAEDLETEQEALEAQVGSLAEHVSVLSDSVTDTKSELQSVSSDLKGDIADIRVEHAADFSELEKTSKAAISDIASAIAKSKSELEDKITDLEATTGQAIKKVSADIMSEVGAKFVNVKRDYTEALSNMAGTLTKEQNKNKAELSDSIRKLKAEVAEANADLDSTIQLLEDTSLAVTSQLAAKLSVLEARAEQLGTKDAELVENISANNKLVVELSNNLTKKIDSLKESQTSGYAFIGNELERLASEQEAVQLNNLNVFFDTITRVYVELADLVDDDILILEKVYEVNGKLGELIAEVDDRLTKSIDDKTKVLTDELEAVHKTLSDDLSSSITALTTELASAKSSLLENIETLRSTSNLKINDNLKAIEHIEVTIADNNAVTQNRFEEIESTIAENKSSVEADLAGIDNNFSALNTRIDNTNSRLDVQFRRLSNLIALTHGSTTGDAELIDIRNGYNGLYHESAGDAVRAIGDDLENLKNSLPDYIPSNAVDGLLYEDNLLYLTSDGVPVSDPVEITGGSGGGGGSTSTVRVTNNLTSNTFTVAKGNPAWIDFTYTSFENEIPTGDGVVNIFINSKKVEAISGSIQHGVSKRLDISEYLKNGTNNVKITCADQYGTSRSLVYNISVVELRIESNFDSTRVFSDTITFRYKIFGQIEKTAHILLDGTEISTKKLSASVSGNESTLVIPKQTHGCHKITAYITALIDGEDIKSNIIEFEILCIESGKNDAMLASVFEQKTSTQGDLLSIPFLIYDPAKINTDVDLIVASQVNGQLTEISRNTITANRELQSWKTRQYPTGQTVFTISYTYTLHGVTKTISKSHTITVEPLKIDISAETDSLQLYLTAQGRSNNEAEAKRASWTFKSDNAKEPLVTTTFEKFNWRSNGWVVDSKGDTCLRLSGDARAVINFKPFAEDFKIDGKTIEFEFSVRDVNSRDTVVIDCFDGTRGFQATPDTAFLQSSGTKVSCRYKDEERIRVAVSVEYADSVSRFVSIYLDGVLSGIQKYAATDNFAQENPLAITLGSSLCGLDLYSIRVYKKALSTPQVLTNYIADMAEPTTKLKLMTNNDILDENGNVSYERVKALGQIPIITFTGPMPTYKGDKKKKTTRMKFEDPAHPEMNFDVLLDQIDVQGTSSQFYFRKNWKVKLPEKRAHIPGAIPAKVFCIKVDYAEATGTHNTGIANYVETLYDREEVTLPPQKDDTRVRTTIQGFPVVLFEKTSEDAEPIFSSKGNFNYDKDAENAFGFTEDYKAFGVECWEFCNNTSDAVNFAGEIPDEWLDDFEPRYVPESVGFERIEELQEIAEDAASGKGIITEAQRNELSTLMRNCMANFKEMHDWVLSTATYRLVDGKRVAITPVPLENPVTYGETVYTEDNEEYRLAKFKHEFEDHFNMHYSSMYYVFTLFALMTDQRAKNLFLTRWKEDDGVYRWYPYFYDNDTIFGINNEGALVFDYFHEDTDQLGSSNVYNGQNSVLWNNFRLCFPKEIEDTYAALRNSGKLTYNKIIDQFITQGSDKWSETIYNADAEYKYICMARENIEHTDENGNVITSLDASNLYQVKGPGEHHLRYFIANRLNYCDSKWYAGSYPSNDIFLRIYTPKPADDATQEEIDRINASLAVVPANPSITITPFSDMYAGVRYKSGTLQQQRLKAGESFTFSPLNANETFGDTETAIYGASEISSLGDLSGLYCGVISLGNASKLTELTVGNADPAYYNDNFREISVGSNRLLRYIDLRNCSGLGIAGENPQKTLELSGCPNIEHIYTEGTNLSSVDLPESGYIKTLHLPSSINTLVIKNQRNITDFKVGSNTPADYRNIKTLCIEDSAVDTDTILANCQVDGKFTVERVRLTGIDWSFDNTDFIKSLYPQYDADGKLIAGVRGIDDKNNNIENAYLVGSCYIKTLTGAEYAEIKEHYPYLDIKFGTMTSNVIFKYTDAAGTEYEHVEEIHGKDSTLGTCPEPVLAPAPAWAENAAFTYERVGWSREKQVSKGVADHEDDYKEIIHVDALQNIAGDRVLYPVFKAIRKSYPVRFINPTTSVNNGVLQTVITPYGGSATYTGMVPRKLDAASPDLYAFSSWYPKPENITGPLDCLAQFSVLDSTWHTLELTDITDCVDHNQNVFDGYELNHNNKTMSVTKCKNKWNAAVLIPETMSLDSGSYTITAVGGFDEHTRMELIKFPETTTEILPRGLYNCYSLFEVTLPESVTTIGMTAFQNCSRLKTLFIPKNVISIGEAAFADCKSLTEITVDAKNPRYVVINDCLIDTQEKKLLQGLSTQDCEIPTDGSIIKLGQHCFSNTNIVATKIPEGVTEIPNNAFSRCYNLVSVALPDFSLEQLGATCFAWCTNLKSIKLPEGLKHIFTYVFDSCALSEVEIPSTVETILERAFGDMPTLKSVKFKQRLNADGSVYMPEIHENAFVTSGSVDNEIVFEVPWASTDTPAAPWGAINARVKFAGDNKEVKY